jgi:hypothetical protein
MRTLLIAIFLMLSIGAKAQTESCSILIDSIDVMTGERLIYSKDILVVRNGDNEMLLSIFLINGKEKPDKILNFSIIKGDKCLAANAKINLLFDGDERIETHATNKFNCKGSAFIAFGPDYDTEDLYHMLKTKKLKMIRISTRDAFFQNAIPDDIATKLQSQLICMAKLWR